MWLNFSAKRLAKSKLADPREGNEAMAAERDNQDEKQRGATESDAMATENARADADVMKLTADLDDLRQTLLRRQADFDNYRKRIERERLEESKRATARVVEALIPIVDGFEHALAAHREAEYENYRKGFELIYKQMLENLAKLGVERIEPVGQQFDPHQHQAMDRTETTDKADGTVLQVFQAGYLFNGRVLRPAMVRVAVHPTHASKSLAN
jgi:molecular chaperone GrpE